MFQTFHKKDWSLWSCSPAKPVFLETLKLFLGALSLNISWRPSKAFIVCICQLATPSGVIYILIKRPGKGTAECNIIKYLGFLDFVPAYLSTGIISGVRYLLI